MNELLKLFKSAYLRLSRSGKKTILFYILSSILISALDALALLIVARIFKSNGSTEISVQQFKLLGIAISLFVTRSFLSSLASWLGTKHMAKQEVAIGQENLKNLLEANWLDKLNFKLTDYFLYLDKGPTVLIQRFIMSVTNIISELVSSTIILVVVLALQPLTAITALIYFILIALLQHRILSTISKRAGEVELNIGSTVYELINNLFLLAKVLEVMPSKSLSRILEQNRSDLANARGTQNFIASLPRYFMESVLAIGFVIIASVVYLFDGESGVLPAVTIFSVAGFRLLPIVNRVQSLVLSAIGYMPIAKEALTPVPAPEKYYVDKSSIGNGELIKFSEVSFRYKNSEVDALKNLNLTLKIGLHYAVVGPSGSGKTTFVDICLGLLQPTSGLVEGNFRSGSRNFAYVPQDSHLIKASVLGNVALEWDEKLVDFDKAKAALIDSQLSEFVHDAENFKIPENNEIHALSGGQRQRIALARAIYRDSDLLVLDEATSSLDSATEYEVMQIIKSLKNSKTVIIVAHRLSTIRDVDEVIYFDNGKILGIGNFNYLRKNLPEFENQIKLGNLFED